MNSWDLQKAVHAKLTGAAALMAIATAIHDHTPQDAVFPYVVIGEDLSNPADTDDTLDSDHAVAIHTWSRYRGRKETKQLQQQVYAALHRKTLAVGNASFTDCNIESEESFLDEDGLTRHGVQRFRVLLDEVS